MAQARKKMKRAGNPLTSKQAKMSVNVEAWSFLLQKCVY
jgi:hypothetical protein